MDPTFCQQGVGGGQMACPGSQPQGTRAQLHHLFWLGSLLWHRSRHFPSGSVQPDSFLLMKGDRDRAGGACRQSVSRCHS